MRRTLDDSSGRPAGAGKTGSSAEAGPNGKPKRKPSKFVTKPPILRFYFFKSGSISGKTVVFSDFICYFLLKR